MLNRAWELVKRTYDEWSNDNVSRLAASLSYYTVFSVAPLIVIAIAVVGLVLGPEAASARVHAQLELLLGTGAAEAIRSAADNAQRQQTGGILATVIGVAVLVWGATNVFAALQDSLNTIWEVKPRPDLGWKNLIRIRLFSFGMVLALAFLMMVSLLVSAALSILDDYVVGLPGGETLWRLVTAAVSLAVFTLLFAMIFKYLPDVRIGWRDVWAGALITAVLFSLGKTAIGLYLGRSTVASVYGAAGSLVLLLLWVYYSSQIVFTGAEFTQVWARAHNRRILPDAHAVPVTEEQRAQEGIPHAARVDEAVRDRDGRRPEPRRPEPRRPKTAS